jgi:cytochrome P450
MQQLVTEQLGLLLTSRSPAPYVTDIRRMVRTGLNVLVVRQWPRMLLALPSYQRAKARVKKLAQAVIDAHRTHSAAPDFINDLLAAHASDPQRFTENDLMVAVVGPYVAGLDTVANTCTFMLYALLCQPDVLTRVLAELDTVLGDASITAEHLKQLPALHGAAMETLRLYPVAPAMQRTTTKPFVFAGYRVDAKQTVLIATSVAHALPHLFPQPECFDIDRYHQPRNEHKQRGAFAPFGLGAHTCLGAGLAEVQIAVIMAELLRTVRFALEPNQRLKIRTDPTLTLGPAFRVRVVEQSKVRPHTESTVQVARSTDDRDDHASADGRPL